jgi:phospholipid-translocating ATPase
MFRPNHSNQNLIQKKQCYRPGSIPHSVLYRVDSERAPATAKPNVTPSNTTTLNTQTKWEHVKWKELNVGDYVKIENDQDIPADIVILSTSETDNICYVETQNLDGETNLKQRQGLPGTANIESEQDCEQAQFYIESEPPHVNIYQYSAVLRWQVDTNDTETIRSGVSHEKADAVTYSNILLRGCVLRNTKWVIGVVVYTGSETKIMLNTGRTPSKRSKMAKATNPHVSKM